MARKAGQRSSFGYPRAVTDRVAGAVARVTQQLNRGGASRWRDSSPVGRERPVYFETLEERLVISGTVPWLTPAVTPPGDAGGATVAPLARTAAPADSETLAAVTAAAAKAAAAAAQDVGLPAPFDIAKFTTTLAANPNTYTMGGLFFASNAAPSTGDGTVTFGSSGTATWTLIGLPKGVGNNLYAPLLLALGSVTLSFGPNLDNQIAWTDGLYTVKNDNTRNVLGGVALAPGAGSFYAAQLIATGKPLQVLSITGGTVTTQLPSSYQDGQAVTFFDLSDPTGVSEATTYYVVNADAQAHPDSFDIAATPGGAKLAGASSGGGQVGPDNSVAVTVTGIADGVVTTDRPAGFVDGQQVLFPGLTGATGDLAANVAYYVIPSTGKPNPNAFTISTDPDGTPLAASATSGTVTNAAANAPIAVDAVVGGLVTTGANHNFTVGQAVRFSNLGGASGMTAGTTYYVVGAPTATSFQISDTVGGGILLAAAATGGGVSADTSVTVGVTAIAAGVVQTNQPTGFVSGQAITFPSLSDGSGVSADKTYYVLLEASVSDATHFAISLEPFGTPIDVASASGGSVKLSYGAPPPAQGALLPNGVAFPLTGLDKSGTDPSNGGMAFTPTRVTLLPAGFGGDVAQGASVVQISGTQSLAYKNAGFSFGVGGQGANQGKYL